MEFTKDSIVTSICGIDSNITIEKLYNSMPEDGIGFCDDLETIIDELNDGFEDFDEFLFDGKTFSLNIQDDYGVTKFLENCFGEKYLMMVSTNLVFTHFTNDTHKSVNEHNNHCVRWTLGNYTDNFVENDIFSNGQIIKTVMTKYHYADELLEINEDNFLSEEEKKQLKKYDDDDENYERTYEDGRMYFMKKSEFEEEKWWTGWSAPQY